MDHILTKMNHAHPETTDVHSISKDDAFHVLQTARRRAVLRYLLARPDQETFQMRELAEEVAAWEHDTTVQQLSSDERQRVYIALYQSHLPKLDDFGIIDYNQNRGIVAPTPLLTVFRKYINPGLRDATDHLQVADGTTHERSGLTSAVAALLKG